MELSVENLIYEYDSGTSFAKRAIDNVNFKVNDNEFIGLIGHTGSGKSTLIQHLNGLLTPTSGTVKWNGKDIYQKGFDRRLLRSHVGLVFQYPEYQLFETTIFKDVCYGPKNLGLTESEIESRAKNALDLVGIHEELWNGSPFELSGGQKRRVAIAGVLAMNPDILILDEPTAGLDPQGRIDILQGIKKIHEKTGNSIVFVTHSMDDVAEYANRIIVVNEGKIVFDDKPLNVFSEIEELEKISLSAPQISYILRDLKKAGIPINTEAITVNDAVENIYRTLKGV